jgi:hypothetical protein
MRYVLNDEYHKTVHSYVLVKAKLQVLFQILDIYEWPASRSGCYTYAFDWKWVWIGAKAE